MSKKSVKHIVVEFDVTLEKGYRMTDDDIVNRIKGFLGECVWGIFPECFDLHNRTVRIKEVGVNE